MTIQKTVMAALAGLMMISQADAQCVRSQRLIRSYHTPYAYAYRPHISLRPQVTPPVQVTTHGQPLEVPPAPSDIAFGECRHVDELAHRLEVLMNELCLDLVYNYSHNPEFRETYAEAYSLYLMARSIHASEHNFDREGARRQLAGADALLRHICDDVRGWTRIPRRQIGLLGINAKMQQAEDTLCHLMEDIGVAATPGLEVPPTPDQLQLPLP